MERCNGSMCTGMVRCDGAMCIGMVRCDGAMQFNDVMEQCVERCNGATCGAMRWSSIASCIALRIVPSHRIAKFNTQQFMALFGHHKIFCLTCPFADNKIGVSHIRH